MKNVWVWDEIKREWKHPLQLVSFIFRMIRYSWQRMTQGYCERDVWNIDYLFMSTVPDMLQQFKDTKHGSPGILGEDYVGEDGVLCNDTCHEAWDGHIHSNGSYNMSNKEAGIKRYDVGVDANSYMPVSIKQIENFLKLQE